jgi:hypothetical protein
MTEDNDEIRFYPPQTGKNKKFQTIPSFGKDVE